MSEFFLPSEDGCKQSGWKGFEVSLLEVMISPPADLKFLNNHTFISTGKLMRKDTEFGHFYRLKTVNVTSKCQRANEKH